MVCHTNSLLSPKELHANERKHFVRVLNGIFSAETNLIFFGSFRTFDRSSFLVEIEKKESSYTVNKLNTVHTGVFTYQFSFLIELSGPEIQNQDFLMKKNMLMLRIVGIVTC